AQAVDPARTPVLSVLSLARALLQAGDVPGTERLLRAVLAERPDQVALLTALGNLLRTQKRWQEAIGCYRAARALRPYLGSSLAAALGEVDRAAEGEAILRTLSQKSPNNPELRVQHGNALRKLQKLVEAEATYRKAIELQPRYVGSYVALGALLCDVQKRP